MVSGGLLRRAEDDFFQVHGFPISGVGADGECHFSGLFDFDFAEGLRFEFVLVARCGEADGGLFDAFRFFGFFDARDIDIQGRRGLADFEGGLGVLESGDFSQNLVIAGLESAEGPAHGGHGAWLCAFCDNFYSLTARKSAAVCRL
ncbi:hypothetical protein EBU02_05960 [bacterium]|nr:hypothetical protein [bacterium]